MVGLETRVKHLLDVAHRSGIAWNLFAHPHESGPVGDQEQSRGPLYAPTQPATRFFFFYEQKPAPRLNPPVKSGPAQGPNS